MTTDTPNADAMRYAEQAWFAAGRQLFGCAVCKIKDDRIEQLERDQRRIALDVIEAAANEADAWDYPELAKDIRAIDVDEIIGRKQ